MFEFQNEKFGKVKVINVTEARASIATIMGDKEFSYVITKNNRPIRAIVNYDLFQKQEAASQRAQKSIIELKDPVKGLLQTKAQELKRQVTQTQAAPLSYFEPTEETFDLPAADEAAMAPDASFAPSEASADFSPEEPSATDQAPLSSSDMSNRSYSPIPEEAQPTEPPAINPAEPPAVSPVEPLASEPVVNETTAEQPEEELPQKVDPSPAKEEVVEVHTQPEREDYFDRFRKLYEAPKYEPLFGSTAQPASRQRPSSAPSKPGIAVKTGATTPAPERVPEKPVATPEGNVPPSPSPPVIDKKASGELPTIQDLLSELEDIDLSSEENEKARASNSY